VKIDTNLLPFHRGSEGKLGRSNTAESAHFSEAKAMKIFQFDSCRVFLSQPQKEAAVDSVACAFKKKR